MAPNVALYAAARLARQARPAMTFLPDNRNSAPRDTWWAISPEVICRFLGVLGFEETTVTYHKQLCVIDGRQTPMFTVVGRRTAGQALRAAA